MWEVRMHVLSFTCHISFLLCHLAAITKEKKLTKMNFIIARSQPKREKQKGICVDLRRCNNKNFSAALPVQETFFMNISLI